jgi:REP element-mobilizing transposase RayT
VKRVRDEAGGFRIVHYSLQDNHLHLIVEAKDKRALSSGMLGFASALARGFNKTRRRHGKVWAQRYHARALRSPTEVRNALLYVLRNGSEHGVKRSAWMNEAVPSESVAGGVEPCQGSTVEDAFSSAHAFDGFAHKDARADDVVAVGRTWLITTGWRRRGLIRPHERPKVAVKD